MSPGKLGALLGVLALLVAACGPAATPTPTTTAPTATTVRATPTTAPGVTPAATPTPAPSPTPAAAGPKYGGIFRNYLPFDMTVWDPHKEPSQGYATQYTHTAAFSRLLQFKHATADSCDNPLELNVAESYKFLDDRTLEVKVRPNVRFHNKPPVNGRAVTADDVVFTFQRIKQVGVSGLVVPYTTILNKVEATGPLTVRFSFTEPAALVPQSFLATNVVVDILPPEGGGPGPEKDYSDPYKSWIGTGPYLFKDWVPGVKVGFTRNPGYFKSGMPYLDGMELLVIPDTSSQAAAFLAGKLDAILRVPPTVVAMLRKTYPQGIINGCPYFGGFGVVYMRSDKAPFNDVRVRRALSMAIDRQALIDGLFLGEGEILAIVPAQYGAYSLTPKDLPQETRRYVEYRPEEAKKLLAEAGFPNGFSTTLETTRRFGSPFNESQEAMLAMWGKVGVKVEAKWYEFAQHQAINSGGRYDNLSWNRADFNPWMLPSAFHSRAIPTPNRSHIKDAEVDKLIDRLQATFDEREQAAVARQIQQRVVDQTYIIQQPTPLEYAALQPYVRNFGRMSHQSRSATIYERMWFDK